MIVKYLIRLHLLFLWLEIEERLFSGKRNYFFTWMFKLAFSSMAMKGEIKHLDYDKTHLCIFCWILGLMHIVEWIICLCFHNYGIIFSNKITTLKLQSFFFFFFWHSGKYVFSPPSPPTPKILTLLTSDFFGV